MPKMVHQKPLFDPAFVDPKRYHHQKGRHIWDAAVPPCKPNICPHKKTELQQIKHPTKCILALCVLDNKNKKNRMCNKT